MSHSRQKSPTMLMSLLIFTGVLCLSASLTAGFAQTVSGGLRGVVSDQNGAAVPGANVVAKNIATGVESRATTSEDGGYSISRVLPGKYSITFEAQGFKRAEVTNVEVTAGKQTVIDASVEPGAISETVTVMAGGTEVLVEKDTAQISTTFTERKVQDLPVNTPGGGLDRIAFLVPGVVQGFGNVNANGPTLSVNGNRARSNNFTIDGVDNNDLSIGGPNYFVQNAGAVSEIQVVTNNFSAEYGRNQGAIVNYVSKSGGNDFHGTVNWEHLDNANFNSLTNLERRSGKTKPDQNLTNFFSYNVGGPVIPNKVFFFTTGFFRRNPGLVTLRTSSLAPTPAGVQALKTAFPNNPAIQYFADFSPFSLPLGNPVIRTDVPQSTITVGNLTVPVAAAQRTLVQPNPLDEYTVRGDSNLGSHRIWGRYFRQTAPNPDAGATVGGFSRDTPVFTKQMGGGWTWTISNTLVNEFRINYSHLFVIFGGGGSAGKANIPHPDEIGTALTNLNLAFTAANGAPILGIGPATNLPQGRTVNSYQFNDNVSLVRGNHQMKMGFDFRKLTNIVPFLPFVNGQYTFGDTTQLLNNAPQTLQVALGPATLSYDELDQFYYFQDDWRIRPNLTLNLGVRYENTGQPMNLMNEITTARESDPAEAFWRQNLPLEARTIPLVKTDKNNFAPRLGFVWSPRFKSGWLGHLLGEDKSTIRGGYGIAYDPAFYNLMLNISTSSPLVFLTSAANVGVPSAVPTGDVVREAATASGLIRFNTFDPRFLNRTLPDPEFYSPYSQQWSLGIQREIGVNNVFEIRYLGTKGNGLFQTINANPFIGNLVNGFTRQFVDPGTSAAKTLSFPGFPQLFPNAKPVTCTDNPATPDNEGVCNGRLQPVGVVRERVNTARSIYHSLQLRFDARFRRQLTYGFTYTYSHAIDNSSEVFSFAGGNSVTVSQNPLDLHKAERGNSGFDARNVFTANFIWDLPFYREQKGFMGRLLGGWQLNGILLIQPGRPFTPGQQLASRNPYEDSAYMTAFIGSQSHFRPFNGNPNAPVGSVGISDIDACIFYARCNQGRLPGVTLNQFRPSSTGFYLLNDLNKGVFTPITPNDVRLILNGAGAAMRFGTPFGDLGRNTFLGDRNENLDLSIFKNFRINERFKIQYRLQLSNALNHPFFGIPNSILLDNAGTTYFNFQENDGGRRTISMGVSVVF